MSYLQGQLLGIGGKQLQRIKQESSARVEVVNAHGNLNGAHPDPLDPQLHALITADSMVSYHVLLLQYAPSQYDCVRRRLHHNDDTSITSSFCCSCA